MLNMPISIPIASTSPPPTDALQWSSQWCIDNIAAGDQRAISCLVETYQDALYRFAYGMTRDAGLSEEVVQDVFLKAIQAITRMCSDNRASLALRPWLYKITLNHTRNALRKKRLPSVSLDEMTDDGVPPMSTSNDPRVVAQDNELQNILADALLDLPLALRPSAVLYFLEDCSCYDIATQLGKPVGTVKSQVSRATQQLRRALHEYRNQARDQIDPIERRA